MNSGLGMEKVFQLCISMEDTKDETLAHQSQDSWESVGMRVTGRQGFQGNHAVCNSQVSAEITVRAAKHFLPQS